MTFIFVLAMLLKTQLLCVFLLLLLSLKLPLFEGHFPTSPLNVTHVLSALKQVMTYWTCRSHPLSSHAGGFQVKLHPDSQPCCQHADVHSSTTSILHILICSLFQGLRYTVFALPKTQNVHLKFLHFFINFMSKYNLQKC